MRTLIATLLFAFISSSALAQWQLIPQQSTLSFTSIKKETIAEIHHFAQIAGSVSRSGEVQLDIALQSVDTGIEVRDERMKTMLFEVDKFGSASVTGKINPVKYDNLFAGQINQTEVELTPHLHGHNQTIKALVNLIGLQRQQILVTTVKPVIINAADFGLTEGVVSLQTVAKLSSIATAVPVTFSLLFQR